jgi:alkylation response protein AidB-like acyl-CoA dehydrogenase
MYFTADFLRRGLRPGGKHGVSSRESRDPIGLAVAGLNRLAQSEVIDRLGLRRQTEQAVFTVTRSGFRGATAAGRTFARMGTRGAPGTRPAAARADDRFDLTPTEDEQMLVDVVGEFAAEVVRPAAAAADAACAAPESLLQASLEIGLPILGVPEALGGISEERSAMAGTLVAEALAKGDMGLAVAALAPGSVATALGLWGTDAQQQTYLPTFTGDDVPAAALALTEPTVLFDPLTPATTARRDGDGFVLDGVAAFVEEAEAADHLLVTAADGDGLSQFLISKGTAGVTVSPLEALDLGRRFADVRFGSVRLGADALVGEAGGAGPLVERQLQLALSLQSAESVGVADRAMEFTLDWVKQRVAFGRVIGSFQALKHRLADHATQLEGAKAAAAYAAQASQHQAPDAALAASVAKSQCGRTGVEVIRDCLQMHGGIGMTYDHDIHLYLRRAVSNEALLGTPAAHHERLARLAGL